MEDSAKSIESLIEKAADYGKTSVELIKLKALDKTSDVASSIIPHSVVIAVIASFLLFLNIGLAFWLGEIMGKIFLGFFVVAGFYLLIGLVLHFFLHNWIKKFLWNYFVKQLYK